MDARRAGGDWTVSARAETLRREAVIVDGRGVAFLLPAVLIPPAPL